MAHTRKKIGRPAFGRTPRERAVLALIQAIRRRRRQGSPLGPYRIARELNERGIQTQTGRPWTGQSVKNILQRQAASRRKKNPPWSVGADKVLYPEETEQFLAFLHTHAETLAERRRLMICDLLLNTGLRAAELCALRVQDTPCVLNIPAIQVRRGKGGRSRTIPISRRLADALKMYIQEDRPRTLPAWGVKATDPTKPLFYSESRRPYTPNGIYRLVRQAGKLAGIRKRIRPHVLRHTFATNALHAGAVTLDVQRILGHSIILPKNWTMD